MSEAAPTANEVLVRRAFELFSARDADGLVELMDPAGEVYPFAIDEQRRDGYRGHDGLRQYIADVGALFEEFGVRIDEVRDVGGGAVLAEGRIQRRSRDGRDIDMAAAWVWTVGDGLITRMEAHPASRA